MKTSLRHSASRIWIGVLLACGIAIAAPRTVVTRLVELSNSQPDSNLFRNELIAAMTAEKIRKGTAILGNGSDFIWAVEADTQPTLFVDDQSFATMRRSGDSNIWYHAGKLQPGDAYKFHYLVKGGVFGGALNIPVYTSDSYDQPGVPHGHLSEKMVHTSKIIWPGMETNYWAYTPAQYNTSLPAALMIWQDGHLLIGRNTEEDGCVLCPSLARILEVTDNLIHRKKLPVMIHLFLQPGRLKGRDLRSNQYDSVTDLYAQFLIEEILPELYSKYNVRRDGYSHAIEGQSSGGVCAFVAGWRRPDQFSRIVSDHGTFTAVAFRNGEPEAGHLIPTWVRRETKRNLRVWLGEGSEDYENEWGSWPTQNIALANSLKFRGYDFQFHLGNGSHHAAILFSRLPDVLTWLWRDYDPSRTEQEFVQDPAEKAKPFFRVKTLNR
jgi:enterochelin esterase family protein